MSEKIKIGITIGDINGIGPELIVRTFEDLRILDHCQPFIYANAKVLMYYRKLLNSQHFNFHSIESFEKYNPKMVNCMNCWNDEINIQPGVADPALGTYAYQSLERAAVDLAQEKIHALITSPINKATIHSDNFPFKGHTEYLADRLHAEPLMLLVHEDMRIATVTTHIPIQEVAQNLSTELIIKKIRILQKSLFQDFGIERPRIAVLGLNPHAGDNGLIGEEEKNIILPAIQKLKSEKALVFGPYPADGFFASGNFTKFDAILAMYHDQGLIPFKTLSSQQGVNYTAGLPQVRTSPDHGTAYDLVGKKEADITSFRNSIYAAIDIYRRRKNYKEMTAHPLRRGLVKISVHDEAGEMEK